MNALTGELNKVLHQPIRTKVMAYLVTHESCDFSTIKKLFELNDGHMTTHMKELVESGYVRVEKMFVDNRPKTIYYITKDGKKAFENYIGVLRNIIAFD